VIAQHSALSTRQRRLGVESAAVQPRARHHGGRDSDIGSSARGVINLPVGEVAALRLVVGFLIYSGDGYRNSVLSNLSTVTNV
jgi:hypothetical protein